jgi:hypothetical protein
LNGGAGLNTQLGPGEGQGFTVFVDSGVQPIVGIYQPSGGRSDFTLADQDDYAFIEQDGNIVNSYAP